MAKYTIETNGSTADSIDGNLGVVIEVCGRRIWVQTPLSLTPYTEPEPHAEVTADAYQRGYEAGLNDAWEAARKITCYPIEGGMECSDLQIVFNVDDVDTIMKQFSASEAIEKIRQYEQEKKEIQVGDEVKSIERGWTAVVVRISNDDSLILMDSSGAIADAYNKTMFVKTGRHFSEIAEVLTKMRGK